MKYKSVKPVLRSSLRRHLLSGLEKLEERIVFAGLEVDYREFPFEFSGTFNGSTSKPWGTGANRYTYRDTFSGSISGNGSVNYGSPTQGFGAGVFDGTGQGSDSCWQSYNFKMDPNGFIADNGGNFTLGGGPNFEYTKIVERTRFPSAGCPTGAGAIPGELKGTWSPSDYKATLAYDQNGTKVNLAGTVTPTVTNPTDIAIGRAIWSVDPASPDLDCLEIDVGVTGAFPRATHTELIGLVKAEWVDGFGTSLGTIFEQNVFWNTGKVKFHSNVAHPQNTSQVKITASIRGDSNSENNEKLINFTPDLSLDSVEWITGGNGGAKVTYSIVGGNLTRGPAEIGFYWSEDGKWDTGDFQATSASLQTNVSEGQNYVVEMPGQSFHAPSTRDLFLIAVVDISLPTGKYDECEEANNEMPVALSLPPLVVEVNLPVNAIRNSEYSGGVIVAHGGPVPIEVELQWDVTSNIPGAILPARKTDLELLVQSGALDWESAWPQTFIPKWEWIPKENPVKLEAAFIDTVIDAGIGATLKALPFSKFTVPIKEVLGAIGTYLELTRNLEFGIREGNFTHVVQIKPKVHPSLAQNREIQQTVQSEVEPLKLTALAMFRLDEFAMKYALQQVVDAVLSPLDPTAPQRLQASSLVVAASYLAAQNHYQAAYDPPDPDFTEFLRPVTSIPAGYASFPEGMYREWLVSQSLLETLNEQEVLTLDKISGAIEAEDFFWQAEQKTTASNLSHRYAIQASRDVAFRELLLPYLSKQGSTSAEKAVHIQTNGLPEELKTTLASRGLSPVEIDKLDERSRNFDASDFEEFDSSDSAEVQRALSWFHAENALNLLREAIGHRTDSLGLPTRNLTAAERSELLAQREQVSRLLSAKLGGISWISTVDHYLATSRRFAFETNNFAAIENDLNFGYGAIIDLQRSKVSLDGLNALVKVHRDAGSMNLSLADELLSKSAMATTELANGKWTDAKLILASILDLIVNAPQGDIQTDARQELRDYSTELKAVSELKFAFSGFDLSGLSDELRIPRKDFPAHWLKDTQIEDHVLGSIAGSRLKLVIPSDAESDDSLHVDPNSNFVLAGSSINVGDRVIGRVALINDKILDFEFYSQATHSDLDLLIQSLRYNLGANARGIHKVELQFQDGVGGTVEKISTLIVDPLNAPPTTILLTPNTAKERISGLTIGRLSAVDPDVGQTHQFVTSDARVTIVGGELRLKSDAFFDRSQGATVSISVTATDSGDPAMLLTQDVLVTLIANTSPWRNSARNVDVNRSMSVTPLDALLIINELNRPTISRPGFKLPAVRPFDSTLPYFDTSGDGLCSPLDALLVINALNFGEGEGEGGEVVIPISSELSDAQHDFVNGFVPSQYFSIGFALALEKNDRVAHAARSMWNGKLLFTNANESASLAKSLQRSPIEKVPIDPYAKFCTSIRDDVFASMGHDLWSLIQFEDERQQFN